MLPPSSRPTLFPYTTLFRSPSVHRVRSPSGRKTCQRVFVGSGNGKRRLCSRARSSSQSSASASRGIGGSQGRLQRLEHPWPDRKSTRLNSSHLVISYAVFCLNAPTLIAPYTLSLHDALPISVSTPSTVSEWPKDVSAGLRGFGKRQTATLLASAILFAVVGFSIPWDRWLSGSTPEAGASVARSEEHTSELQSPCNLVCRLLLECSHPHRALHSFPTRRSSDLRQYTEYGLRVAERRVSGSSWVRETANGDFARERDPLRSRRLQHPVGSVALRVDSRGWSIRGQIGRAHV